MAMTNEISNEPINDGNGASATTRWIYDGTKMAELPESETSSNAQIEEKELRFPLAMWLVLCVNYNDEYGLGPGYQKEDKERIAAACGVDVEVVQSFFDYANAKAEIFRPVGQELTQVMSYRYPVAGCPNTPGTIPAIAQAIVNQLIP